MVKGAITAAAAVVALPVILLAALLGGLDGAYTSAVATVPAGLPAPFDALYPEAAAHVGIPASLLAAVGECDQGRIPDCTVRDEAVAATPRDAVFAVAAELAADGAAVDARRALLAHNPSDSYAAGVMAWAIAYGWTPADPGDLAWAVLHHDRIGLRRTAADDVRAGLIDRRVLAALLMVATEHRLDAVGPFVSGHGRYVAGTTRVSNHVFGRAVDLPVVDGAAVAPWNAGAKAAVELLLGAPEWLQPNELGCPWRLSGGGVVTFTAGHHDHLHLGFGA